jgi:RNA-directed DNA polymerase
MEDGVFHPTEEGTPQGGVASPLLANIALHGLERDIAKTFTRREEKPSLIRYADDFVVLHPTRAGVQKAWQVVERWLRDMGVVLKPSKTRITHTLEGEAGFDFLGVNVRQYRVGKTHSGRDTYGHLLGYKTLMKPSKEAVKRHLQDLAKMVRGDRALSQEKLIEHLNPVIGGWANGCRTVVAKRVFGKCDSILYSMLRRWAQRRHPRKGKRWIARKYWGLDQGEGWTFKTPGGQVLKQHAETPIRRHTKVKGTATPYEGNLI